jgi:hypothetical protein
MESGRTDQYILYLDVIVKEDFRMKILVGNDDLLLQLYGDVRVCLTPADGVGKFHCHRHPARTSIVEVDGGRNADSHQGPEGLAVDVSENLVVEVGNGFHIPKVPAITYISTTRTRAIVDHEPALTLE